MGFYNHRRPARSPIPPNPEHQTRAAALKALLPQLPAKDHEFAQSLIDSCAQYGSLTQGRLDWVEKLIDRAKNPPAAPMAINVAGVRALFDQAAQALKWPKIRLEGDDGTPVVISIAGPKSKYSGQLMVTDGGQYPNNRWFGRVEGTEFHASRDTSPAVRALLSGLSDDPEAVIGGYGRLTGGCALCGRALDDPESIDRGVGPVCARKWGLRPARPARPILPTAPRPAGVQDFTPTVELD
jgi:hypothetical protein